MTRYKDVNECLMAGVPADLLRACLDQAQDFAPKKVRRAIEYRKEFMDSWFNQQLEPGLELPFGFPWKIRPAETTVWTGIEKSGKTTMLSFILMALLAQGERALIASFEVRPAKTLKKFSRQAFGGYLYDQRIIDKCQTDSDRANYKATAEGEADETLLWLNRGIWLYDHVGIGKWRDVLEDMRWARNRLGIKQFILDNFMRLGMAKDDYAQQADAMAAICGFAQDTDAHVHVVVHQNKSEGHKGAGGKRTVSGAFEIIATAHNIVEVQRDEFKGQEVSTLYQKLEENLIGQDEFKASMQLLNTKPDGNFILHAQRDGEVQNGSRRLWFLHESQQYIGCPKGDPKHYPYRFVAQDRVHAKKAAAEELPTNEEMGLGGPDTLNL